MSVLGSRARTTFHPLEVAAVDRLTGDAVAVTFAVPDALAADFTFAPGQSLTLRRVVEGREERRSYSICAPLGAAPRIGVREVPGGLFSRWLVHDLRPGDLVEVQPPSGRFTADPAAGGRHLCIAAGSGITPVLSIAASLLAADGADVTLLYGNRTSATVMFAEELADLKNSHPARLQLAHVLSREPRDVELFSGRLDADRVGRIVRSLVPLADVDHVWLCGPFAMVTELRELLVGLGVAAERVHTELFHVDAPPPPPARAAAADHAGAEAAVAVTVVLDGTSTSVAVAPDRTVLDAAQEVRADLPFACKGGVCGTCRARVTEGAVDMRRNYALEPAEVDAGFVLTCQSYAAAAATVDFDA